MLVVVEIEGLGVSDSAKAKSAKASSAFHGTSPVLTFFMEEPSMSVLSLKVYEYEGAAGVLNSSPITAFAPPFRCPARTVVEL